MTNTTRMIVLIQTENVMKEQMQKIYKCSDKVLLCICRAGQNIEVAKLQVLAAVQEYVKPALVAKFH
jgi:hypothetical protein